MRFIIRKESDHELWNLSAKLGAEFGATTYQTHTVIDKRKIHDPMGVPSLHWYEEGYNHRIDPGDGCILRDIDEVVVPVTVIETAFDLTMVMYLTGKQIKMKYNFTIPLKSAIPEIIILDCEKGGTQMKPLKPEQLTAKEMWDTLPLELLKLVDPLAYGTNWDNLHHVVQSCYIFGRKRGDLEAAYELFLEDF